MKALLIEATAQTPRVEFDAEKGLLKISGRAFPQKILDFYAPVIKWVDDYIKEAKEETVWDLKMEYINSASTMIVANLLKKLSGLNESGKKLTINWHHSLEDEDDMLEIGKEMEVLLNYPFNFISYESELS